MLQSNERVLSLSFCSTNLKSIRIWPNNITKKTHFEPENLARADSNCISDFKLNVAHCQNKMSTFGLIVARKLISIVVTCKHFIWGLEHRCIFNLRILNRFLFWQWDHTRFEWPSKFHFSYGWRTHIVHTDKNIESNKLESSLNMCIALS